VSPTRAEMRPQGRPRISLRQNSSLSGSQTASLSDARRAVIG